MAHDGHHDHEEEGSALPEIALQRVPSVATTDRGRALPLYTPVAADLEGTDLSLQESYLVRERSQGLHLLRTGPVEVT